MGKTNDLRKLIHENLKTVCKDVYFETAATDKLYPHIVFSLDFSDLGDLHRQDIVLNVDIWDRSDQAVDIENLTDAVETLFLNQNIPQDRILPTFFLTDRKAVPDEDKRIRHRLLRVQIQNYER